MVAEQFDDDYAQYSEYTLSDPDEEDPMAFLFADDGDGEDEDGEDTDWSDMFRPGVDGETAPIVDETDEADDGEEPSEEQVLALARLIAAQRHPGFTFEELPATEQHNILAAAVERLGYRGAGSSLAYGGVKDVADGSGDAWDATPGGMHTNVNSAAMAEDGAQAVALAERIAQQRHGARLADLSMAERDAVLDEAAASVGYRGAERMRRRKPGPRWQDEHQEQQRIENAEQVERRAIRLAKQRALDDIGKRWSELTSAEQDRYLTEGAQQAGYSFTQRW